ncbi:MAG: hypothetical protein A2X86_16675 [Bdellovibrionales bacterium GWA2_49_15]|nr:MAG: hypothetical protein A2X86_16675 [Bdellovibrionales bacterium GWA2_49_15]HAZ14625.1 hypothetical protein [Bdellovibrionales bacterium]
MNKRSEEKICTILQKGLPPEVKIEYCSGFIGNGECDIILLAPRSGVLMVFEIKNWGKEALEGTFKSENEWEVKGLGRQRHPLKQAEQGIIKLINRLPSDLKPNPGSYTYLCGCIFPKLTRVDAQELGLFADDRLLPPSHPYLFKDDLDYEAAGKILLKRISDSIERRGWRASQISERIASRLWKKISPNENAAQEIQQRRLNIQASLDGLTPYMRNVMQKTQHGPHRVNGVVGSGKTVFAAHKALTLAAQHDNKTMDLFGQNRPRILVLSLTVSSASKARNEISRIAAESYVDLYDTWPQLIEVCYFHEFLRKYYNLTESDANTFISTTEPIPMFDAIIFDEFQDANEGWGRFIAKNLNDPSKGLLLLTFDPAQGSTYNRLAVLFEEVRSNTLPEMDSRWPSRNFYLKVSHRVPENIGIVATRVHAVLTEQSFEEITESAEREIAQVIHKALRPEFFAKGGIFQMKKCTTENDEDEFVALTEALDDIVEKTDASFGDIAIALPPSTSNPRCVDVADWLEDREYPAHLLEGAGRSGFFERGERITLGTPMKLKGLELPIVIIAPSLLDYLEENYSRKDAFYQAVTRATSQVIVLGAGKIWNLIESEVKRNKMM